MTRRFLALAFVLVAAASCATSQPGPVAAPTTLRPSVPQVSSSKSRVAGATPSTSPTPATPGPLVVVILENHSSPQVLGNACCPYLSAKASRGRIYANYHAVAHPSLPNYLAFSSGSTCGKVGTDTVTPYCARRNLWDQLRTAGIHWRVYQESMPSRCGLVDTSLYAVRHDPEAIYADQAHSATCVAHVVALPNRIAALPALTFVTPNICDDMHSCAASTGDRWLKTWLPRFLTVNGTRVVVTFDEGSSDNHVAAFEVGAGVPHTTDRRWYTHYSLLAGIENAFGLARLGNAANARPLPL
jgi:phosphatidylinositol-3-phosphatase